MDYQPARFLVLSRSEQTKLCALVIVGVNERGEKHFLAIEDGVRESTQSWREVLLRLKSRKMNAPQLAVGDGAMGFWAALDEVYPDTRHQRCWVHKTANRTDSQNRYNLRQSSRFMTFGRQTRERMQRRLPIFLSKPMKPSTRKRLSACKRMPEP